MLQSSATQTVLLKVIMNEMIFNIRNLENVLKERWTLFEARLKNLESTVMMLQSEVVAFCRDIAGLPCPPV